MSDADLSSVNVRGVIEGFYGPPWTHEERLDMIRFCGAEGLNTWVHAPKDDPYHRKQWREPYPAEQLAQLGELVDEARANGVEFAYSVAPGLDIEYSNETELATLVAKCEQVKGIGVSSVQLLWDDVEHDLKHPADVARYGGAERPSGIAQRELSNRLREAFPQDGPLVVCPMGYAGTGDSPYRRLFTEGLHPEIVLYWTGPEVVSIGITREALNLCVSRFRGHTLMIWDNYPVNDFEPDRLFLGPLLGRDPRLADGQCAGYIANAMLQAVPSKLALATVADWTRDPGAYDPVVSYERALRAYGAEVLEALRRLAPAGTVEQRPDSVRSLIDVLELGVDAATGQVLLEPFV
jgi:hyaluronoglucosaminidase